MHTSLYRTHLLADEHDRDLRREATSRQRASNLRHEETAAPSSQDATGGSPFGRWVHSASELNHTGFLADHNHST
jgi:hypothetical protein